MEKKNLKLSELMESMREISSEGNHFVKGDTFIDVVEIARQRKKSKPVKILRPSSRPQHGTGLSERTEANLTACFPYLQIGLLSSMLKRQ